jgi:hypothetical protein
MPRKDRQPNLSEYIRYAVNWRQRRWNLDLSPKNLIGGVALSLLAGFLSAAGVRGAESAAVGVVVSVAAFAIYMVGAFRVSLRRERRTADTQARLRREAFQIAERLEESLNAHRLERDLSREVCELLDSAAAHWRRAKTALQSPYWRRADLPSAMRSVREQALVAADQGMQEILVLLATSVPAERGRWTFAEVVDELAGRDLLTTRGKAEPRSPYFDQARGVGEKLRDLADQVEEASRRLVSEELILGAPKPGSAIEATLAELRQLKEAEDELRQDLRG